MVVSFITALAFAYFLLGITLSQSWCLQAIINILLLLLLV